MSKKIMENSNDRISDKFLRKVDKANSILDRFEEIPVGDLSLSELAHIAKSRMIIQKYVKKTLKIQNDILDEMMEE